MVRYRGWDGAGEVETLDAYPVASSLCWSELLIVDHIVSDYVLLDDFSLSCDNFVSISTR